MNIEGNLIGICPLCAAVLFLAVTGEAQPVTKIAEQGNGGHTLFVKSDGSLWTMGDDEWGELGDGNCVTGFPYGTNRPELIVASNVTAIAAGYLHSLFLKSDGSLWAMGDNEFGELGDGTTNDINVPEQIVPSGVKAIAAGSEFSIFIKTDGSLWIMGYTGYGYGHDPFSYPVPADLDPTNYTTVPQQIVSSGATAIAAGYGCVLFLKSDGSLWAMLGNGAGQLGDGTYNSTTQPVQIVAGGVTAIAAGNSSSLFLENDGSLWGMGYGGNGQLGAGATSFNNSPVLIVPSGSGITAIAADVTDTMFQKSDGSLWGLGESSDGQLGDGTYGTTYQPEQIMSGGVTAIAAGYQDTLFIKSDGSLWGMGYNGVGQLGLGDYTYDSINPAAFPLPVQIVAGPPGYNQISVQLLSGGNVSLSFMGMAGTNYELDRSFGLSPANWVPQVTNPANVFGVVMFTNTPDATTNNFWRIRSVP